MKTYKYVIIGNSAAGVGAAEAIREVDGSGSLALISDEPIHAYSRALIAFYLMGQVSRERLSYRREDFYQVNGIDAILGRRAEKIDFSRRRIHLTSGDELGYEKLLLATGGRPVRPPIPGIELEGVHTFQSLADAEAVRESLAAVRVAKAGGRPRAVVVGGGLIGLQAAEALADLGFQVDVVELMGRVLSPVLDATASGIIQDLFERRDVRIHTGVAVREIRPDPKVPRRADGVRLGDGAEIPTDLVIMAVGVVPQTELVAGTAVKVNKGIVTDQKGETSVPGVYAAGDVAETYDAILGATRPLPIWPKAYYGGRVAGLNMAGKAVENPGDVAMNASHFFGFPAVSAGIHDPEAVASAGAKAGAGFEVLAEQDEATGYYKKLVLRDGQIVGMVCLGDAVDRSGIILGLMKERVDVEPFKDKIFSRFALVSLPEGLRQRRVQGR